MTEGGDVSNGHHDQAEEYGELLAASARLSSRLDTLEKTIEKLRSYVERRDSQIDALARNQTVLTNKQTDDELTKASIRGGLRVGTAVAGIALAIAGWALLGHVDHEGRIGRNETKIAAVEVSTVRHEVEDDRIHEAAARELGTTTSALERLTGAIESWREAQAVESHRTSEQIGELRNHVRRIR